MSQVAVAKQIWNYQEIGDGKGIPIIILHGWGRSGNEWIPMAKELSQWSGRKVYVVDLPGFGGSSLPQVKDIYDYSDLVIQFCKYLDIKKVVLIGHSLGGRIGIVMASRYVMMVEKLILVDPAGVKPRSIKRVIIGMIAKLFVWVPRQIRLRLIGGMMDSDYRDSPALRDLYRAVVRHDLRSDLSNIKCRTELVWGECDPILPLSLTKVYLNKISQATVRVVWGAGHDPHLTKYEQTLSILEELCE